MTPTQLAERNARVESLQRFVWSVVNRPQNRTFDREDLFSVGILAAIKAVDTYPGGMALMTWVWPRVETAVRYERERLQARARILRVADAEDIADVEDAAPDGDPLPHEQAESGELRQALMAAIDTLPDRERRVLTLRYGLAGGEAMMIKDVAAAIGCSARMVRYLERQAIRRLRHPLLQADLWAVVQDSD